MGRFQYLPPSRWPLLFLRRLLITLFIPFCLWGAPEAAAATVRDLSSTGPQPSIPDSNGKTVQLYNASYALLISESRYIGSDKGGWRPLVETEGELDRLSEVLRKQGFAVRRVTDASGAELYDELRNFISLRGNASENRIIVFFSGHGYTRQNGFGYLVPVDAPDPDKNAVEFFRKAMPIQQLILLAQESTASHMLFMFDSCFSGTIFMSKGDAERPDPRSLNSTQRNSFILGPGRQPVRQFIAAGGPNEKLPAKSVFVPLLIGALEGKLPVSGDDYITSKQLGLWIEQNLPGLSGDRTHPHSDVIRDPELAFGDMVFQTSLIPSLRNGAPGASKAAVPPVQVGGEKGTVPLVPERECNGETILLTPHPNARIEIEAREYVCYEKSSFTVLVDDIKVTNKSDTTALIKGAFSLILPFKNGEFSGVRIYPKDNMRAYGKTYEVPPGVIARLPSLTWIYPVRPDEAKYLQPPYDAHAEFNVEADGQRGGFWMSTAGPLMKLWKKEVTY